MRKMKTYGVLTAMLLTAGALSASAQTDTADFVPKVEGKEFTFPAASKVSREEYEAQAKKHSKNAPKPTLGTVKAKSKTRGDEISKCGARYGGKCSFYQFVNEDFTIGNTCGQAALATAVWAVGANGTTQQALASEVLRMAPPKITVPGVLQTKDFGTDWRQMNVGLDKLNKKYGIGYAWKKGVNALTTELAQGRPCIVMIDCGTLRQYNYAWLTGHWITIFGYKLNTKNEVMGFYCSNFPNNYITWDELNKAWGGSLTEGHLARAHGTPEMFCVVYR